MEDSALWLGFAAVLSIVYLFHAASRRRKDAHGASARPQRRRVFHAVEIRNGGSPCSAARRVAGKRFLSSEAPAIPLASCSLEVCSCKYAHFEDRRARQRRDVFLHQAYTDGERIRERRLRIGRRKSDRLMLDGA